LEGVFNVGLRHDVVPLKNAPGAPTAYAHDHTLSHADASQVSRGGPPEIVEDQPRVFRVAWSTRLALIADNRRIAAPANHPAHQESSFNAIRSFLNDLEANWFPVELNPFEVVNRELKGAKPDESCICERFIKDFFNDRVHKHEPGSGQIIHLSPQFFGLGGMMDWLAPQRDSIRAGSDDLDTALIARIAQHRASFDSDPRWLESTFPALPFNPAAPATFTYFNLVRTLILEAKSHVLKKGDGTDFCHAAMASAFATVGTLDKHWKRRVESLPKPNRLARIYYAPELSKMVDDIESAVGQK
jgi:hypothetical protein